MRNTQATRLKVFLNDFVANLFAVNGDSESL